MSMKKFKDKKKFASSPVKQKNTSRSKKLKIHVPGGILIFLRSGLKLQEILKPIRLLFCKFSLVIHLTVVYELYNV